MCPALRYSLFAEQGDSLDIRAFAILFGIPIRQLKFQLDDKNEPDFVRFIPYSHLAPTDAVRHLVETYKFKHIRTNGHRLPSLENLATASRENGFIGVIFYDYQSDETLENHFTMACKRGHKSLTSVEHAYDYIFINNEAYKSPHAKSKPAERSSDKAGREYDGNLHRGHRSMGIDSWGERKYGRQDPFEHYSFSKRFI